MAQGKNNTSQKHKLYLKNLYCGPFCAMGRFELGPFMPWAVLNLGILSLS
jgi:hypothetical protein